MNTQPPYGMDLEARLRAHYRQPRLAPPDSETLWARLAPHLGDRALTASHAEDEQGLYHLRNHADHAAPPAPLPPLTAPPDSRRFFSGVSTLAAALIIVLLAVGIFGVFTLLHDVKSSPPGILDRSSITLLSVSMASAREGWAVGTTNGDNAQGVILHYDLGRWWQVANPYDTGELRGVFMLSATDGWIVGDKGTILHYTGSKWLKVESPVSTALGSVSLSSPTEGWAMGQEILHYYGGVWSVVSAPKHGFIFSIEDASYTGGWAVGGGGTVLQYQHGQWQSMSAPKIDLYSVGMIASNVGWAVGSGGNAGNLLHYQDGVWSVVDTPAPQETLRSIALASPELAWAVGNTHSDTGLILRYSQGKWTQVPSPTNEFLLAVTLTSAAEGWAIGSHGVILHYLNDTWSVYTNPIQPEPTPTPSTDLAPTQYHLHSISMVSPDEGWAVGDKPLSHPKTDPSTGATDVNAVEPIMLHYKGGRWTEEPLPSNLNPYNQDMTLSHISMVSATEGWAIGTTLLPNYVGNGVVVIVDGVTSQVQLHYTGGKWVLEDPPAYLVGSTYMRSAQDGWAIGSVADPNGFWRAALLHYDGQTWTPVGDPFTPFSVAPSLITGTSDDDLWVSGIDTSVQVGDGEDGNEHTALLHYDGKHWSKVDPHIANGRLYSLAFTSSGDGWAVGMQPNTDQHKPTEEDGLLLHYHNGIWEKPTLVKDPFGQNFFSLHGVAMLSSQEGWAVGDEGILLHYVNGVWERAPSPTSENMSTVTFVSASEGWAIGSNGLILHYHGGAWCLYQGS